MSPFHKLQRSELINDDSLLYLDEQFDANIESMSKGIKNIERYITFL